MIENKIILKSLATSHQKIILYGLFLLFFLMGLGTILWYVAYFLGKPLTEEPYTVMDIVVGVLFLLSLFLLAIALSREGLIMEEKKLFKSIFLFGKPVKSTPVDISEYTDISLMGFNMNQKYAFGASPNPDQSYDYKEYRVYLLNELHSRKYLLTSLNDANLAKELVSRIETGLSLKNSRYNPPVSQKTRMRRR